MPIIILFVGTYLLLDSKDFDSASPQFAILRSPVLASSKKYKCLSFYYHMWVMLNLTKSWWKPCLFFCVRTKCCENILSKQGLAIWREPWKCSWLTWQKEAVGLFGSWKASRCVFSIIKKKVRSMRSTDNDNAGLMLGSLKTSRWFGW